MIRIAIDIGGTFTDITSLDEETMEVIVDKAETTPGNLADGVINAIDKIGRDIAKVDILVHGTTVGMNTLIQRNGAKVGLITTKGFRDVYEIGRGNRAEMYNFLWRKPKPLVPRYLRLEVDERMKSNGEIMMRLQEQGVVDAIKKFKEKRVESIAVCLLNAYANPCNEEKIKEIIEQEWPGMHVSLSSYVAREYREYERTSTTVLDAYIKKNIENYLDEFAERIKEMGFKGLPLVTSSSGALTIPVAREKAINMVVSGPTCGAIGAARLGKLIDRKNILTIDVGGTSFDLSLIRNGMNVEREESDLVGFPMIIPSIDIRTIGAGGGSIARVDVGGMLTVGPDSAGADPGPICYGKGGTEPTVTDAAVLNGLIDPNSFLGGEMALDAGTAEKRIGEIASKLNLTVNQAAEGILNVCKNNMANAVREILVGEGLDPRDFCMMAFGGGGGIFAGSVAKDMGISTFIVPFSPGVFSAWGMLSTDFVHNFSHTYIEFTEHLDFKKVARLYSDMEQKAKALLKDEGFSQEKMEFYHSVDMRYDGQGHFIEVPLPEGVPSIDSISEMNARFRKLHEDKYGHQLEADTETVNFRLKAIGRIKYAKIKELGTGEMPADALIGDRRVFLDGNFIDCPIYDRNKLLAGNQIEGPAIIQEPVHTTVVSADQSLHVDTFGNLVVKIGG